MLLFLSAHTLFTGKYVAREEQSAGLGWQPGAPTGRFLSHYATSQWMDTNDLWDIRPLWALSFALLCDQLAESVSLTAAKLAPYLSCRSASDPDDEALV